MKKYIILISILFLVACSTISKKSSDKPSSYNENEVYFFMASETTNYYLVPKELKLFANNPNLRKVTFLLNEKEPIKIRDKPIIINSMVKIYVFNCVEQKYYPKETYMYSELFGKGYLVYKQTISEWKDIPTNKGMLSIIREASCIIGPLPDE